MIYCPKCGTANRDGSRFCNECGEKLSSQTQVKCPQCGALNAVQSVFCSECGGRLLPPSTAAPAAAVSPAIKGLSLPTKAALDDAGEQPASAEAPEEEVPAWLKELGATLSAERTGEPVPDQDAAEVPDWLHDLRASLPEESDEQIPGPEEAKKEGVSDWLAELHPVASGPVIPAEIEKREIPDWLAELQPVAPEPEAEPEVAVAEELGEGEIPDWLAELQTIAPEPEVEVTEELEEGEIPDWLAELQPIAPEPEVAVTEELEEGELPDWLAELRPPVPEPEVVVTEEIGEGELPDWLAELRPVAPAPEVPSEATAPEELEEGEIPDWLAELRPPVPGPEVAVTEELGEGEIPDWLAPFKPQALKGDRATEPPVAEKGPSVQPIPDWLEKLGAEGIPEEAPARAELPDWLVPSAEELGEPTELLERADIPAWLLALKPQELRAEGEEILPEAAKEELAEETGLLAGLQGTLPVEMLIAQPRAVSAAEVLLSAADTPQARLFAEIVGKPSEAPSVTIPQPRKSLLALLPRLLLYLALIAAVTLPFLLPESPVPRVIEPVPAVVDLYKVIESLDNGAPVLVAFDYDPTTSGEMDLVARAVVGHLMDRQARLVVVSLLPAGPATAQSVLDSLAADRSGYADAYGESYANLGYIPGQAAAVRLLGQSLVQAVPRDFYSIPLSDLAAMEGLTTTQSFDLLIELAPALDTLRWWIEQGATPYGVPLGAGVAASVEPLARAYYETDGPQLVGLVGGVVGAASYEALRSGTDRPVAAMAARLDSQLAGHVLLVVVLLVGNVFYLMRRASGRGR